jgi:hypothetical protein
MTRSNSHAVDDPQLRIVANWLDGASRWLESEVRDNRQRDIADGVSDPEEVIEILTFLRPELDRMVIGLRRAADLLLATTMPLDNSKMPPEPTTNARCSRGHLRLVK